MPEQPDWRYCHKCGVMYYDGFPAKGACPAGGGPEAAGLNFDLPYDVAPTPHAQDLWRFCRRCSTMFYDGFPRKGTCPVGGGHEAAGFNFTLPHDVPPDANRQAPWRFCHKCHGMFFDGFPNKGRCPAGGGHEPAGYVFVLPHHDASKEFDTGQIHVPGGLPLSGSAGLVITRSGHFTFTTHAHNAGFENIDYALSAVLMTRAGLALAFQHDGSLEGTVAGLPFGEPDRNDDRVTTEPSPQLASDFDAFSSGVFTGRLVGAGTTIDAIGEALAEAAGMAGIAAAAVFLAGHHGDKEHSHHP